MEKHTPESLYNFFVMLANEETAEFLARIASELTAESIFFMLSKLDPVEGQKFSDLYFDKIGWQIFPIILRQARKLAREYPDMSDEEFDRRFAERNKESQETYDRMIHEVEEAKLKQQRNRKSSPKTIRQNVQICDLRRQDQRKWSQKKLARHFHISDRAIRDILKSESHWRRLAAQLKSN